MSIVTFLVVLGAFLSKLLATPCCKYVCVCVFVFSWRSLQKLWGEREGGEPWPVSGFFTRTKIGTWLRNLIGSFSGFTIWVVLGVLFVLAPYYIGNPKREPNLENYPHGSLINLGVAGVGPGFLHQKCLG